MRSVQPKAPATGLNARGGDSEISGGTSAVGEGRVKGWSIISQSGGRGMKHGDGKAEKNPLQ